MLLSGLVEDDEEEAEEGEHIDDDESDREAEWMGKLAGRGESTGKSKATPASVVIPAAVSNVSPSPTKQIEPGKEEIVWGRKGEV